MEQILQSPTKSVEDLFSKADEIVLFIRKKPVDVLQNKVDVALNEWVGILLDAANSAHGNQKIKYALAIQTIGEFADSGQYKGVISELGTNPEAIAELIVQGGKEIDPIKSIKD